MVTDDDVNLYVPLPERVEKYSFCPVQRPVIDSLTNIKTIAQMDDRFNALLIQRREKYFFVEFLKIVVEDLGTFTDAKVGISYKSNSRLYHIFEGKLHPNYNPVVPVVQQVHLGRQRWGFASLDPEEHQEPVCFVVF